MKAGILWVTEQTDAESKNGYAGCLPVAGVYCSAVHPHTAASNTTAATVMSSLMSHLHCKALYIFISIFIHSQVDNLSLECFS